MRQSDGLGELRDRHPGWVIGSAWVTCASGPDFRALVARRAGCALAALTPADLSALIAEAERG